MISYDAHKHITFFHKEKFEQSSCFNNLEFPSNNTWKTYVFLVSSSSYAPTVRQENNKADQETGISTHIHEKLQKKNSLCNFENNFDTSSLDGIVKNVFKLKHSIIINHNFL